MIAVLVLLTLVVTPFPLLAAGSDPGRDWNSYALVRPDGTVWKSGVGFAPCLKYEQFARGKMSCIYAPTREPADKVPPR